ncbi:hypothetical protein FOZ60_007380 [Perkinsus olseni]|uniref:Adenosine deaminase domain-containing protein n=1 Tax=Perkinsus olseni TaxID=32597 RepID=A0A7J6NLB8_PEROL|nr:hypothetical protein FOZ60_007380 [Perkinsus olseni]
MSTAIWPSFSICRPSLEAVVARLAAAAKRHWKISLGIYTVMLIGSASITGQWLRRRGGRKQLVSMVRTLPKVDLHCHLHGCIRRSTLSEMIVAKGGEPMKGNASFKSISLKEAFNLFHLIYEVITDSLALRRIIREALADCYEDNVMYLELRTTPRPLSDLPTRRDYVDILVEEVDRWQQQEPMRQQHKRRMDVRLILGLDRAGPIEAAEETLKLAIAWKARRPDLFVGMDLAGNPVKGDTRDFIPLLERARCHGLKITVHTAEVPDRDDEIDAVLAFKPDRLGHALWVTDDHKNIIMQNNLGIEVCPTSNRCTLQLKSLTQHPCMQTWLSTAHKVCICTDDSGVFSSSLSDEIIEACRSWGLTQLDAVLLQLRAVDMAFCDEDLKKELRDRIHTFIYHNPVVFIHEPCINLINHMMLCTPPMTPTTEVQDRGEDVLNDVDFIIQHYCGYFHRMEVIDRQHDRVSFRLIPKNDITREVVAVLHRSHFILHSDSSATSDGGPDGLLGRRFETIEQLLSAVMGAHDFGEMLNSLISSRLESSNLSPRESDH